MTPTRIETYRLGLGDQADAADALAEGGYSTDGEGGNFRRLAAMAWVVMRRTDPDYTLDQAMRLTMADIEVVTEPPETSGGNGETPPLSPETGT